MKIFKKLLFVLVFPSTVFAQNVGINNTNPQQELDVTGNINLTGSILANSTKGTAGQVLQMNASKEMVWADLCNYENFKQFYYNEGTHSFDIPSGVTTILAEVWAGGGGGSGTGSGGNGAGGGGSGYAKILFDVSNATTLTITVGGGGIGGVNNSNNPMAGGPSSISSSSQSFSLNGGAAATVSAFGQGSGLSSSSFTSIGIGAGVAPNFMIVPGHAGHLTDQRWSQMNATDFVEQAYYGKGGDAANVYGSGGSGGYYKLINAVGIIKPAGNGNSFGAGGGGGHSAGGSGANGTVILHW